MQVNWCNGDYMSNVINFAGFKKNTKPSTCNPKISDYINNNDNAIMGCRYIKSNFA
jgi:hypothetical protein